MRGAVFTQPDRIMGEDENHPLVHQRSHPQGVAAVVAEGQEGAAIRNVAAVQGDAIHQRAHAEFAHTVVQVAAGLGWLAIWPEKAAKSACALPLGEVGTGEVGRATEQFRQCRAQLIERVLGRLAGGDGFTGFERGIERTLQGEFPGRRQHTAHAPLEFRGLARVPGAVGAESIVPLGLALRAGAGRIPGGVELSWNLEGRVGPAHGAASTGNFLLAERLAVTLCGACAGGRKSADLRTALDERGRKTATLRGFPALDAPATRKRYSRINRIDIVTIDIGDHIPAIGFEAAQCVVAKPGFNRAIDGDAVIVIEHHQPGQAPDARQRAGLMRDTFHEAAIASEHPGEVIDDRQALAIELACEQALGQGHADRIGQPLTERPGGGLDTGREADLRMPGCLRVQLAKVAKIIDRERIAAQMQQRIEQHRAMAIGQHEAITVEPAGLRRVVFEMSGPQRDGNVGHAHRHAGMTGARALHCVHGKHPDGGSHARRLAGVQGGSGLDSRP